jgi:hypothetical protein
MKLTTKKDDYIEKINKLLGFKTNMYVSLILNIFRVHTAVIV